VWSLAARIESKDNCFCFSNNLKMDGVSGEAAVEIGRSQG
jgi:hypothetical protein